MRDQLVCLVVVVVDVVVLPKNAVKLAPELVGAYAQRRIVAVGHNT